MFNHNSEMIIFPLPKPISISFFARGNFCCRLITFANSLDPDQDRQNVGPDLGPKCFDTDGVPKRFFRKSEN